MAAKSAATIATNGGPILLLHGNHNKLIGAFMSLPPPAL